MGERAASDSSAAEVGERSVMCSAGDDIDIADVALYESMSE